MQGLEITLKRNKQYEAENSEEFLVISGENNATSILVHFPEEYLDYSKRVDFNNVRGEKWTIGLYTPEDKTIEYGDEFDKLNFVFTLPTQVTVNGELKIQFIAYLCDGSETLVPFKMLKLKVNEAINYAKQLSVENPDLIVKAYEYSNLAMESAKAAENSARESAASALSAQQDATKAEQYAKTCETKANEAASSAQSSLELVEESSELTSQAQSSASQAQQSAEQAQQSASEAAQDAEIANNNSQTALTNSNNAVNTSNKALEIVENLTVSKEVVDCEQDPNVIIETDNATKHKNLKFTLPEPKKGTSYRNRGAWDSGTQYINDEYYIDTVSRYGCTYYCKITNTNQAPTDSSDNDYWGLLALKGNDAGITIIDNLTSEHADYALSANQGRILKDLIASSVERAINQIVDNSPDSLDTLKKIAQAIDNDANFSTTIKNLISQNSTDISSIISGASIVGKSKYLSEYDTRNVNSTPEEYFNSSPQTIQCEFKSNEIIGLSGAGTYSIVITSCMWTDSTGGYPSQIAQNQSGIYYRVGTGNTEWGSWEKLSTTSELNAKYDDLQTQINNMLNGTTTFTLLKAKVVDLV